MSPEGALSCGPAGFSSICRLWVPLDALRERFEAEYLPALRYVTVDTAAIADPQVLAITDPDDVPMGQLAKLIAPCVVFSEDRHLRKPGLAPPELLGGRNGSVRSGG